MTGSPIHKAQGCFNMRELPPRIPKDLSHLPPPPADSAFVAAGKSDEVLRQIRSKLSKGSQELSQVGRPPVYRYPGGSDSLARTVRDLADWVMYKPLLPVAPAGFRVISGYVPQTYTYERIGDEGERIPVSISLVNTSGAPSPIVLRPRSSRSTSIGSDFVIKGDLQELRTNTPGTHVVFKEGQVNERGIYAEQEGSQITVSAKVSTFSS